MERDWNIDINSEDMKAVLRENPLAMVQGKVFALKRMILVCNDIIESLQAQNRALAAEVDKATAKLEKKGK